MDPQSGLLSRAGTSLWTLFQGAVVDAPSLDFTAQKSRIALKNHLVRPPKDPRILLQKASVIPIHSAPPQEEGFNTKPVMMKVGGGGVMGIKLPGFGGGIPALKKKEKGVSEKSEEVTGQISEKELTANVGIDVREQSSTKQREAGPKMGGVGAIGVKLPAFGTGLPILKKTDRGVKMREDVADDGEYGTARAEGKGAESKEKEVKSTGAPAVKLPSFGAGFPMLRKTERGAKMRSGEDLEKSEADNLNDTDKPDGGSPSNKADVGNPLLSELKFKLKKTDKK
ncbi:uncharacterized protein LOC108933027 isoform X4 [Scleropages formosus]|uniref:uncharacterized protein LOC108933027 isoform X4 n=1 Tax=Scleropages formosus TaxID=113540 RepID=UPI0010FAB292|nr:uncharacterized protein LOC108933027 isoform X4 [Scleropages formosus]